MPYLIAVVVMFAAATLSAASIADSKSAAATSAAAAAPRARTACTVCGRVQSVRRVAARNGAPETYEITVRLHDGSTHMRTDATPANWRRGERIVFIAGDAQAPAAAAGQSLNRRTK